MSNLYLVHHGILGQKWGVRRFQNKDGSLTAAGKKRYGEETPQPAQIKDPDEEELNRVQDHYRDYMTARLDNANNRCAQLIDDLNSNPEKKNLYSAVAAYAGMWESANEYDLKTFAEYYYSEPRISFGERLYNPLGAYIASENKIDDVQNALKEQYAAERDMMRHIQRFTGYSEKDHYKSNVSYGKQFADKAFDKIFDPSKKNNVWAYSKLEDALDSIEHMKNEGWNPTKITPKLSGINWAKASGWNLANAIKAAGLESAKIYELSPAQIAMINKELAKM